MAIKELEELDEIKKQFDELMAKAEEIVKKNGGKPEDERWRAKERGKYWFVGSDFSVLSDIEAGADLDFCRWEACNYFKTEEEAKKVARHFDDYLILRADAKGYEPKDVSCLADYYYVYWGAGGKHLKTVNDSGWLSGTIYFENEEAAEASIAKHGDIWKRYLGVEG